MLGRVMGAVDGESGLADAGHASDREDGDGTGKLAAWVKQFAELRQLRFTTCERGQIRGQLRRRHQGHRAAG